MTVKEILSHCRNVQSMYVPVLPIPKNPDETQFICIYSDEFYLWFDFAPDNWQVSTDQFGDLYLTFDC